MLKAIGSYVKLYLLMVYLNLKARSVYTVNFVLALIQSLLTSATSILIMWMVLERFRDINGWNIFEIGFMLSLAKIVIALNMTFFQQIWAMDIQINLGEIDRMLLKPKSSLFLFLFQRFDLMWLGDLFSALALLVYTSIKADISWNIVNIVFLLIIIACSTLIFASLMFLAGATAFWFLRSRSIREFIFSMLLTFNPYPVSIYGKGIQWVLSFMLPLAFIYYYPALYFFNKSDLMFPRWITFCSPLVTIALLILCNIVWRAGIRAYKSSGT